MVLVEQMATALAAVHAKGITHLDVKMENMYLRTQTEDNISFVLADFGLVWFPCCVMVGACGTQKSTRKSPSRAAAVGQPGPWIRN